MQLRFIKFIETISFSFLPSKNKCAIRFRIMLKNIYLYIIYFLIQYGSCNFAQSSIYIYIAIHEEPSGT